MQQDVYLRLRSTAEEKVDDPARQECAWRRGFVTIFKEFEAEERNLNPCECSKHPSE